MLDSDVGKTVEWMKKAIPNPVSKNLHTQLGVHYEEIAEMTAALKGKNYQTNFLIEMVTNANKALAMFLKENDNVLDILPENRKEILDGICDQIVTGTGFGFLLGMDVQGAFGEVNRSNFSKFDENGNPVLDANMKIVKGPNYFKPNLDPYL